VPATLKPLVQPSIEKMIRAQRRELAVRAVRIYAETKSLRKTAAQLNVSHQTVANLLAEMEAEAA